MKPYYHDNDTVLHNGDARHMDAIADGSIQCVVTSPPYWGLRKYAGVPDLIWGGDPDCDHEWAEEILSGRTRTDNHKEWANRIVAGDPPPDAPSIKVSQGAFCQCGAWRGSYGHEPTPELYVEHTVEVLREVWRVLRDDGVVFWNIGDSYARHGGEAGGGNRALLHMEGKQHRMTNVPAASGLKVKDLVLMPFRVTLAAQADGWWVRSVIIWDKANPMPESVRDRPTTSHEYIIMLTKSPPVLLGC